jgi:hypothetical protein
MIDEEVYDGQREVVGPRKISHFVQEPVRPHVMKSDLQAAYRRMGQDRARESEALRWAKATCGDVKDETSSSFIREKPTSISEAKSPRHGRSDDDR